MASLRWFPLMAAAVVLLPAPLRAQLGSLPDASDPALEEASVLVSAGLVRDALLGQRPWSWAEIARIVEAADVTLRALRSAQAPGLDRLERIRDRLARRVEARRDDRWGLDDLSAEVAWLDSPARGFPENGLGGLDASLNPLADARDGRVLDDGATLSLEAQASAEVAPWLVLQAAPRLSWGSFSPDDRGSDRDATGARLQRAAARVLLGNLALTVGREATLWGHGVGSGLLFSRNARPPTMARLSSDAPIRLPWWLEHLGPTRLEGLVAGMGEDREFPGAFLVGAKMSILPHPDLELGVTVLNLQGGEGAPEASLGERLADILLIPDLFVSDDYLFSEKIAGGDVRVRIPPLAGLELYLEGALTDFDLRRPGQTFWMEAAYQAGAFLPRLGPDGAASLRLEAHHTGVRFYRHHYFVSGLTLDGRLVGSGLGPDARGAAAEWSWERRGVLTLRAAWEDRSVDRYEVLNEPFEHNIVKTEDLPNEVRWRLAGAWRTTPAGAAGFLEAELGIERAENFLHASGDGRTNALLRLRGGWRR